MSRQISTLFTARVIRVAGMAGLDTSPLFRAIGIDPSTVHFPPIAEARHLAVWEMIMRGLRDPAFPFRYAREVTIDDYGLLGLAAKTAPTIGAALRLVSESLPAYTDAIAIAIHTGEGGAFVEVERAGAPSLGRRVSTEATVAEIVSAVRSIGGSSFVPQAVTFRHPLFVSIDAYKELFGVTPELGAERDGFALRTSDLERPLVRSDAALFAYLGGELAKLSSAAKTERRATFRERVEQEILRQLQRGPRASKIARSLGVSVRSLQRHLASERTSFDAVLDGVRCSLATAMLTDGKYTVAEVADAAGFADAASFSRAYKRWTNRPPSATRRA